MTDLSKNQLMLLRLSSFNQRGGTGSAIRLQGAEWNSAYALFRRGLATIERSGASKGTMRATAKGLALVPKPEPRPSRGSRHP